MTDRMSSQPQWQPTRHRCTVGNVEVVVLADGYRIFSLPDAPVVNADGAEVNKARLAAGMPAEEMTVHFNPDVTNNPALFARRPGWHAAFDIDGDKAETVRREMYDMLAACRMSVLGFHHPFPCLASVEIEGDGYRTVPL